MDFGVVLQNDPPAARVVDLARQAETHGFSHVWTFDSHLLWQEPYVVYSQILAATRRVKVGPMVTNPVTRDPSVTASAFATLNEMFGNRTVCGIGRGDSAVRVLNGRPASLAQLRDAVHVIRELGSSRAVEINGSTVRFPWSVGSQLEVWVAGYGPKTLALTGDVADGFILQLADPDVTAWTIAVVREAAEKAGRDPASLQFCVAAPMYVGEDRTHMREQTRWFGGMVGNHVAELVARYGQDSTLPRALTDYVAGRTDYDYNEHGRASNTHTDFVPDEVVDRFCMLGTWPEHVARLTELRELGVTHFAGYLMHDNKEETLRMYGEHIIPAMRETVVAKA
ncbi:TIGR03842 family LLM class F420-dependent oxidoreductase [Georgenia subflava]|uniref:TIGR03842 family LLM class F420-dependent oxidoreductase n=1 Tax=Georgenia subflava TaxID=1622177 RepID=A0A6N7EL39_9MICO|nr:TIGR03842 family LLM class F420-dependent oxidoreductase [Georgenia subflava]MPV38161.1 TIGR03842 family LLM class F420-dependent oxidoreductase [Georgenia subflava]